MLTRTPEYPVFIGIFFIGYFLFEVPSNLVMAKIRPSFYLPSIVLAWGCVVIGMSQAATYEGFLVGRFFLGSIEAGLFPGALYLMTCWYTKKEIGKLTNCTSSTIPTCAWRGPIL